LVLIEKSLTGKNLMDKSLDRSKDLRVSSTPWISQLKANISSQVVKMVS
jgi:hypothetical protein